MLILREQVAYVFNPDEDGAARPSKKRRVSKKGSKGNAKGKSSASAASLFVPLLNGAESQASVELRRRLYDETWSKVHNRIEVISRPFF